MAELDSLITLDKELVSASRDIKVLSEFAWDPQLQHSFIANWLRGEPSLPDVRYAKVDHSQQMVQLASIAERAAALDHPLGSFIKDTALSYLDVARMIACMGTERMSELSIRIYGRPSSRSPAATARRASMQRSIF